MSHPGSARMREFWIGFSGEPRFDEVPMQRLVYTRKPEPIPGEDLVHVREVSPLDRELLDLKLKMSRIEGLIEGSLEILRLRLNHIDAMITGGVMAKATKKMKKTGKKKTAKKIKK